MLSAARFFLFGARDVWFVFYYMANAGGRLVGTLASGMAYQLGGLSGCLWTSAGFALVTGLWSLALPRGGASQAIADVEAEASD